MFRKPAEKGKYARSKNLDDAGIATIVGILDGWTGPLTWEALIDEAEMRLYSRYTRQALHKHERIRAAFVRRKRELADASAAENKPRGSLELQAANERISRLLAENRRLVEENDRLLEQFARWAYNLHAKGLDATALDAALPEIDRGSSEAK